MSAKAPNVPGGTSENKEERFEVFQDIQHTTDEVNADDETSGLTEVESYCVNCGENGSTRLLLTRIPYFREVVLMSFNCEHCDFANNEVQFGGSIQEQGLKLELKVQSKQVNIYIYVY